MVDSIMCRYMGISYPMHSKYNQSIIYYINGIVLGHKMTGNDNSNH
jgi:hypothetical protein